jgi:hypothetical protein
MALQARSTSPPFLTVRRAHGAARRRHAGSLDALSGHSGLFQAHDEPAPGAFGSRHTVEQGYEAFYKRKVDRFYAVVYRTMKDRQ